MEHINQNSINLNKYISNTGICSRRDAEKLIIASRVTINEVIAKLGNRVFDDDVVKIDGRQLQAPPKTVYIALNKPVGIISTTDSKERKNIIKHINYPQRLFPIGRLDKPSEGLIFLTNDGNIVNKILRAGNNHEKEYIVSVNKKITDDFVQKMANGIPILGTITQKCTVKKVSNFVFQIILTQGLNRQIRRMCEYLNYKVTKLKRTRIMNVKLGTLKTGNWRELTLEELTQINKMIATSSKTEEASLIKQTKKKIISRKKTSQKPTDFNKKRASFRKNSLKFRINTKPLSRKKRK